ncbi:unnamed protein product [Adineta ricciae]|uniref:Uncharacterized protein n=1 Tax=Adineta ricciae TaxID=249248 RepID=A0A814GRE7_ADIRI|nr:unnamed protein product [Adineta ricciae]
MSESTLNNFDGIPQYAQMMHSTNVDSHSKSMTIIVQNPFDDPANNISNSRAHTSHPVRFNQELLNNFNINVPITRQPDHMSSSNSISTTSLIPLPTPIPNNLGVNMHHMNQASITPTMIGTYPPHQSSPHSNFDNHHMSSTGIHSNNPRFVIGKVNPYNGAVPNHLRYPTMMPPQAYRHQMMKPRMMAASTYGQMIPQSRPSQQQQQQQQQPIAYDPNAVYGMNGQQQQVHHVLPDDNILKSLLQPSETDIKPHPPVNCHNQSFPPVPKPRKKRKGNDFNTSCEDDIPAKVQKRKKKGAKETEKFVEYSLQQLRNLPMLTPVEPLIDVSNELCLSVNFSSTKKYSFQGEFGDVFLDDITDYYRPHRRAPPKPIKASPLERRYRLCSNVLDRPPCLPSPPLQINTSEKLSVLINENSNLCGDESIVSTSTIADDEDLMNDIQTENHYLLETLSNNDFRALSPVFIPNETQSSMMPDILSSENDQPLVEGSEKVSVTLTLTTEAANNVQSVIAAVADLLKMAYPPPFDVHQTLNSNTHNCTCSSAPNSNNILSLSSQTPLISRAPSIYKIGRETSTSIQSLIDSQPKICRNCSQNLTNENWLKKRFNELPNHLRESTANSDPFIYFCHEQCFNTYVTSTNQPSQSIKSEPVDKPVLIKREEVPFNELKDTKRWKRWNPELIPQTIVQSVDETEIDQLISKIKIPTALDIKQDKRICVFCNSTGDLTPNGPGRLLNLNVGQWCHLNCAFWSSEVYETLSGALMSVEQAFTRARNTECVICKQKGSSLNCFYQRCPSTYHFQCAIENECVFYKDKTIMCPLHALKTVPDDHILLDKSILRRIWIERDEIKQIQNYMTDEHEDKSYILRIGSLILHNIGQLLPHQIQSSAFHNRNYIYPVGYIVTRFHWSLHYPNRRCVYQCSIIDVDNKPMFRIVVHENDQTEEYLESSAKAVWYKIVREIDLLRRKYHLVKMFPIFVSGEDLFGLTEPHIVRLIESLPGVETLPNYAFKYGRLQLFDMPLTVNPTGCARSEPKLHTHFRRHAQATTSSHGSRNALPRSLLGTETNQVPYGKQFVLSKSTQYRKLKAEWRQNVYLAKSRIQGLGLFAARDLEKHTMIIEYIGELIRNEVANNREKLYEAHNRGIYMFRLDEDCVIDATVSGCLARYVNHSCDPNAFTEVVQVEKENKIVIIANRRITKGEEIMYDYKFDFEDDSKIPCLCGAINCRKWMN